MELEGNGWRGGERCRAEGSTGVGVKVHLVVAKGWIVYGVCTQDAIGCEDWTGWAEVRAG